MVDQCNELNQSEKTFVDNSSLIWKGPKFTLYELPISKLDSIAQKGKLAFEREMKAIRESQTDSEKVLYFNGFESSPVQEAFSGSGAFSGIFKDWNHLVDEKLKSGLPGDSCEILFWARGFEKDLFARSIFEFIQKDGEQTVDYKYDQFQHFYCSLKDNWMRICIPFVLKTPHDRVMLSIRNKDLKNYQLIVDDLLIRKKP